MVKKSKNKLTTVEEEISEARENESSTNGITEVWNFFSSMKLGLVLLLIIAAVAIIGTLIPVDPQTNLPTFNVYQQIWFRGILGLLCMNLLVCSINRWKVIKNSLAAPKLKVSENYLKQLKQFSSVRRKGTLPDMVASLETSIKSQGYRLVKEETEGTTFIAADRGRIGVLGSLITHISFLLITAGAIYGGFTGYEGYVNALEGQTFSLTNDVAWSTMVKPNPKEEFQVKVNRFWIDYRNDGSVKGYYSDLAVIDQGKEKLKKVIRVNDPLIYNGVKFYQSSYGSANKITAKVVGKKAMQEKEYTVYEQNSFPVEGTDLQVKVDRFIPDFDTNNPGQSRSNLPNNPAVIYELIKGGQTIETNYRLLNTPLETSDATVTFTGYQVGSYTGLSVRRDPGVPIVWFGSGLMVMGMSISYLWQHRKIWVVVREANGIAIADIGATTDKHKLGMESDFNNIVKSIQD
jgi:cytochrome c biogenesis protein